MFHIICESSVVNKFFVDLTRSYYGMKMSVCQYSAESRRNYGFDGTISRRTKFSPRQRPFGGAGRPMFNQLEMITTFTYKPSLVMIDARNFELSW